MAGGPTQDNDHGSSLSDEEVPDLWKRFRSGEVLTCGREGSALALSVDGASRGYRFVCVACGRSSSWFEDSLGGKLRVRTTTMPHALDDD